MDPFLGFAEESAISVEVVVIRSLPAKKKDPRDLTTYREPIF
jgi:hypothetical protein